MSQTRLFAYFFSSGKPRGRVALATCVTGLLALACGKPEPDVQQNLLGVSSSTSSASGNGVGGGSGSSNGSLAMGQAGTSQQSVNAAGSSGGQGNANAGAAATANGGQSNPAGGAANPGAGAANSGAGAAGGSAGGAGMSETAPMISPLLVDDLEDGDGSILDNDGRTGTWTTYNDGTGQQEPASSGAAMPEAGGADGSAFAMHTSGSGFTDWGAGLQFDFNNAGIGPASGQRMPYDASDFQGIRFMAKGTGDVRVELATEATTTTDEGGTCTTDCYDTHGASITLAADWTEQTILFSEAMQEGWGAAAEFAPSTLLGIAFRVSVTETNNPVDFDFWIDDVSFVSADDAGSEGTGGAVDGTDMMMPEPEPVVPMSTPGQCADLGGYNGNGSATYYYFDQGSSEVNCSYAITGRNPDTVDHITTGDGRYFGAMNTQDYNNAAMCGACVEMKRDDGRSVTITIVDQCPVATNPKCTAGHIDLSVEAFNQIGNQGEGHLGTGNGGMAGVISWNYVPCPVTGNVIFKLKEPDNANWNEVLIENHPYPISSVEINDQPAERQSYNYWRPPDGKMGSEPYHIRVTDVNGAVIDSYIERADGDIDGAVQLSCQ